MPISKWADTEPGLQNEDFQTLVKLKLKRSILTGAFLLTSYNHTHSDQSRKRMLFSALLNNQSVCLFRDHTSNAFLESHAKQRCSSDTLSKLNNSSCFYLPDSCLCQSETLPHICPSRHDSSKLLRQLTRWRNILFNIFFSLAFLGKSSWCAETKAGSQLALGEAWHKTGYCWRDEPRDFWRILVMSHPPSDSSEMVEGKGTTNNRGSCCLERGDGGGRWWGGWWKETLMSELRSSSVFFNVPAFISCWCCQQ